ncbi:MAG: chemotaxis protein CheW [Cyanobacteriota bacterium]|nr:chemotaxis protein CheW [Cyanobacteriota bacterium]
MTNFPLSFAPSSSDDDTSKVIMFNVARYWFALPIAVVLKVVNFPPEFRTTLNEVGLVDLGDRAIALLDLRPKVNALDSTTGRDGGHFLTIVQVSDKELCAIPVDRPPTLRDISLADVRALPNSATVVPPLNLASHVAVLDSEDPPLEVFLLDLQKISIRC